ncbi:MAG: dephospho-CoA kinase [Rikenellaceae bacterium]
MKLIGITGGIGAAKTTFSMILDALVYKIYNCDFKAKELMVNSEVLVVKIKGIFGENAYEDGQLNRKHIANLAFNDKSLLQKLNDAVHPIVDADIEQWTQENCHEKLLFVESAILFESGLTKMMDYSINVSAPLQLRVSRVCKRDHVAPEIVEERISNQMKDEERNKLCDFTIVCDDRVSVIKQALICIDALLTK